MKFQLLRSRVTAWQIQMQVAEALPAAATWDRLVISLPAARLQTSALLGTARHQASMPCALATGRTYRPGPRPVAAAAEEIDVY